MTEFPDPAPIELADINAASMRLQDRAVRTPLLASPYLTQLLGAEVFIKPECLQRTGSFKFRGAWNAIATLGKRAKGGVVACSSGNHAQGVAEAARLAGIPAHIVIPADAPAVKLERTRQAGAEVVLFDRESGDRDAIAADILAQRGGTMIHPFNNPAVIAGQGTVGLEIMEDLDILNRQADAIFVPCGGGGLTSGIALATDRSKSRPRIYTVEPEGFDDYRRSLASGRLQECERATGSICDALLAPAPGPIGFQINKDRGVSGLAVTDHQAMSAVALIHQRLRLVSEPGGAVAVAALFQPELDLRGKTVIAVISGGNIDPQTMAAALNDDGSLA